MIEDRTPDKNLTNLCMKTILLLIFVIMLIFAMLVSAYLVLIFVPVIMGFGLEFVISPTYVVTSQTIDAIKSLVFVGSWESLKNEWLTIFTFWMTGFVFRLILIIIKKLITKGNNIANNKKNELDEALSVLGYDK